MDFSNVGIMANPPLFDPQHRAVLESAAPEPGRVNRDS